MIRTLMSIEDDSVTQMLNRLELEDAKFCENIEEAWNGEVALKYFEALNKEIDGILRVPEIILLDLNMPVMDGWEFLDLFQKQYPQFIEKTKIFILSSSINPSDREKAKEEKIIEGFLSKPLDEFELDILRKASIKY